MIILASSSPRRRAILNELGLAFEVHSPDVEEVHHSEHPEKTVVLNAEAKLQACIPLFPQATIISADTVVVFEGAARGKPASRDEARGWFREFSGKPQYVITAMGIYREGASQIYTDTTTLRFRELDENTITTYLNLVSPTDKAGGYNIDEHGDMIIDHIEGSYTTIMGLSHERVTKVLGL